MKNIFLSTAVLLALASSTQVHAQTTIADWTFETSVPATAGPFSPETGAGTALGSHAGASTYSSPAGNGSTHSFSSNTWAVGDYYQFQVSTLNYSSIALSFDQTSSSTGPAQFQLEYSTNGTSFTNIGSPYSLLVNGSPNTPWTSSAYNSAYTFTPDLSSVSGLANDPTLYFRLVDNSTTSENGGTVASTGTDRVDNVDITGIAAAPEPSAWALSALGIAAFAFLRRRWVGMQNS